MLHIRTDSVESPSSILYILGRIIMVSSSVPPPPLYPAYLPVRPEGPRASVPHPPFEAEEPALRADPAKPTIFKHEGLKYKNITPRIGTELRGIQLSQLDAKGLDEIALLAAERGVLVFVSIHSNERAWVEADRQLTFRGIKTSPISVRKNKRDLLGKLSLSSYFSPHKYDVTVPQTLRAPP